MATKYIIDTSVVVKWFFRENEPDLDLAKRVLTDIQNQKIECLTSDFLLIELINTFLTSKKSNAKTAIKACNLLLKLNIRFIKLNNQSFFSATILADKYNLTIYDSLFLNLASENHCKVITADNKMARVSLLTLPLKKYPTFPNTS